MSDPLAETWALELEDHDSDGEPCEPSWLIRHEDGAERPIVAEAWSEPHARLASTAPELARLLLEYLEEGSMDPATVRRALERAGVAK